ncbi:hypothetical protein FQN57_003516 [Myotisia sp. PD_48]|nr:hypothetical protein FQN57_003516 [Myotisia sp. PD_48]
MKSARSSVVLYLVLLLSSAQGAPVDEPSLSYASGIIVPATPPVRTATMGTHGPFSGVASSTGALTASAVLGTAITPSPAPTSATTYSSDGQLHDPQPAPYYPGGGVGANGTQPVYNVRSDYDFQSLALALYWEWMKFDLFETGLSQFPTQQFMAVGLSSSDRALIGEMANQAQGHATLLSNILGEAAPEPCTYNYPFTNLPEFLDFSQKVATFVESTVYGFLAHLDSREAAQLLQQSIAAGARQHMVLRQFQGLTPIPVWFEAGVPQSWGWSLAAPFISSCPSATKLVWQNFPALRILNQPSAGGESSGGSNSSTGAGSNNTIGGGLGVVNGTGQTCLGAGSGGSGNSTSGGSGGGMGGSGGNSTTGGGGGSESGGNSTSGGGGGASSECTPGIVPNSTTSISKPGREIILHWDVFGTLVGPNNSYVTTSQAGRPSFVAWVTQLNVTYSPLTMLNSSNGTVGKTVQPNFDTFAGDPGINGTVWIAITDENIFYTPFNLSLINEHVVAGPALYQAS